MTNLFKSVEYNNVGDIVKKFTSVTLFIIVLPIITIIVLTEFNKNDVKFIFEKNTQVRVYREKQNRIDIIPLEEYLIGVLAGEMPVSYDLEALKAQAVAARTYTLKKISTNQNKDYDVVDSTNDQVYLDNQQLKSNWQDSYDENYTKVRQAVSETSGEYLTYNGEIIKALFFSTSSGKTEDCKFVFGENLPYLVSVSSQWDENSPSYEMVEEFTKEEFYSKLGLNYSDTLDISITRNPTNSINVIYINGISIKGTDFRFRLGLRSTNIEIVEDGNVVRITSKGFGHGVGLSQYGAKEMAGLGYKYRDILKYYYHGIDIKKI